MPYTSMDEVPPALKGIEPPINLAQANFIAGVADEIGGDNAWPQAITRFKELYEETETGWVKKSVGAVIQGKIIPHDDLVAAWVEKSTREQMTHDHSGLGNDEVEFVVPLLKADEDRRLVYGVVLVPDATDLQEDIINELEIEKAAHSWMSKGLLQYGYRWMDDSHAEELPPNIAHPVESYIAPTDFDLGKGHVKKGSWVLVTHIPDDTEWALVKSGRRNAYSMRGFGTRRPIDVEPTS